MGKLGVAAVVTALVTMLSGCAEPSGGSASGPVDAAGSPIPIEDLVGVRVVGAAILLEGKGDTCWSVRYDDGGASKVEAHLLLPEGYTATHAVMADPSNPGKNFDGTILVDPAGDMVGFADTGVMIAATYGDPSDPIVAEGLAKCGWEGPPLVPDVEGGVTVDPDGLPQTVYTCTTNGDGMAQGPIDLDACDKEIVGPEDLDREVSSS